MNEFGAAVAVAYAPRSEESLAEWAEENVKLRATESLDASGPYRRDRCLPAARLVDEFWRSREWEELWTEKGSQSGFTVHTLILIVRAVDEEPQNTIYAIDSAKEAGNISRRLRHLLEDCRATRLVVDDCADEMLNQRFSLPGMDLHLIGSHSAGAWANKSAGFVVMDEVDKYKEITGEPAAVDLGRQRLKAVAGGKLIGFSTPTVESGTIHREYVTGSRHRYFVPCPHCGHMQTLEWDRLKFGHCKDLSGEYDLEEVRRATYYECANRECEEKIEESAKGEMLAGGEWRPTNYREVKRAGGEVEMRPAWTPGKMTAQISDLYATHAKVSWGRLAVKWIEAQGKPGKLHDFFTQNLGVPFTETAAEVEEKHVLALRKPYKRGTLPEVPVIGAMAVDMQDGWQRYLKAGFRRDGTVMVCDWGDTLALEEADMLAEEPMLTPEGKEIRCQRVIIDEGGTDGTSYDVRRFVFDRFPRFLGCKGGGWDR